MEKATIISACFSICICFSSCDKDDNPTISTDNYNAKILFTANNNLCIVNGDGSNFQILLTGSSNNFDCRLSADGSEVVFANADTNNRGIYLYNLNSKITRELTNDTLFHASPIFSPDGKRVIFLTKQGWLTNIFQITPETNELIQLTTNLNCFTPNISKDGSQVTFWLNNGGDSNGVVTMTSSGSNLKLLGQGTNPQFFPDSKKILYQNFIPPYEEGLYSMNFDGSNKVFLTKIPFQTSPQISPDGSRIVFSYFDGNYDIYVMDSDGTNVTNLTNSSSAEFEPSFSPDGSKIIYINSNNSSSDQLCIMNANGSNKKVIIDNVGKLHEPMF